MNLKEHISDSVFEVISKEANDAGIEVYVIGGYVRDALLNRPCKDIDIVVKGSGIDFAKRVASKFEGVKTNYFKNFGTAMIKVGDLDVEFVGARKESYNRDSRKPVVEDGTLQDDQNRRDFTINALAISLNKDNYGDLVDPFNGLDDLNKCILRTPNDPEVTYSDDPLRMLRAIRFSCQLGFDIEEKSYDAITTCASRIEIVSGERIIDEINKMVLSYPPSFGFKIMFDTGLLKYIFPEFVKLHGVERINGKGHKDNFYHTLQVLDNLAVVRKELWIRWAAILHDIAKPPTKRFHEKAGWTFHGHEDLGARMVPKIFRNLKLPLDERMKYVQKLVRLHLRPIALVKEIVTDSAVRRLLFEAGDDIDDLMDLCEADITSKNQDKVERYLKNFKLVRQKLKEVEEKDRVRNWQPPIDGDTIMKAFGIEPCKEIGVIKNLIKEAILDGEIQNDFKEAYAFMIKKGEELGLKAVLKADEAASK